MPAPPHGESQAKRTSKKGSENTGAIADESATSAPATPPSNEDLDHDTLTGLALAVEATSQPPPWMSTSAASETKDMLADRTPTPTLQETNEEDLPIPPEVDTHSPFRDDDNATSAFATLCEELCTYRSKLGAIGTNSPKALAEEPESISRGSSNNSFLTYNDDLKLAEHIAKSRGLPPKLALVDVAPFLLPYGYDVIDHKSWARSPDLQPKVQIELKSHIEFGDHTQYELICKVCNQHSTEPSDMSWRTLRRLKHIREGLHAVVKKALGLQYKRYFGSTAFAHHVAPSGTTLRLRAWLNSLASCINAGGLEPALVATTFRLLDGPGTPLYTAGKSPFFTSDDIQNRPVTAAMFGSKNQIALPRVSLGQTDSSYIHAAKICSSDEIGDVGYVEIVFQVDGLDRRAHISAKPLGLEFSRRTGEPLKIAQIHPHSHAAELGLEVGWEVKSLCGEDISMKTFQEASDMIKEKMATLPCY